MVGGERAGDEVTLAKTQESLDAGVTGLMFGRNVWQRDHESLRFAHRLRAILEKHPSEP